MKTKDLVLSFIVLFAILAPGKPIKAMSAVTQDPDVQAGFPVQYYLTNGTFRGGSAVHTLIANLDADPELEIVSSAHSVGPLYAWEANGSMMSGWPATGGAGMGYPAAGKLVAGSAFGQVVAEYFYGALVAYDQRGVPLPGWPQPAGGLVPPALADVDGDGLDEIFSERNDGSLYAFKADGTSLAGWPMPCPASQHVYKPAIADLDRDGGLEIVVASGPENNYMTLCAFHHTGVSVSGFPISFTSNSEYPVIGDVDGDGNLEIVIMGFDLDFSPYVRVYSGTGALKRAMRANGNISLGSQTALADLDGDNVPEIVVQTSSYLSVWKGNGSVYPGWPRFLGSNYWMGNSAPVVGDVDGDQLPDIVITLQVAGQDVDGEVRVYNRNGIPHPRFPKYLRIGMGAVPAIADIDLDGRNEIAITGNYWDGHSGFYDSLWVLDLGGPRHGKIQWGQFAGGSRHGGLYVPPPPLPPLPSPQNPVYLPIVSLGSAQPQPAVSAIHGRVTYNGTGIAGIPSELRFYDGFNWSTKASRTTSNDGTYNFAGVTSLGPNQLYYVRYENTGGVPDRLSLWATRTVSNLPGGSSVGLSEFDIADLQLVTPADGAAMPLPITFEWKTRAGSLSDLYSFVIFDPTDGDPAYQDLPVRNTNKVGIPFLPPGFSTGKSYAWTIWILGSDGAVGIPREARLITFASQGGLGDPVRSNPNGVVGTASQDLLVTSTAQGIITKSARLNVSVPLDKQLLRELPCTAKGIRSVCSFNLR